MDLNTLTALSPIDGRYRNTTLALSPYFSEYGLIRYRVLVEIEYFIALCELPLPQLANFDPAVFPKLRQIFSNFSEEEAKSIKEIEKITNHDVKAVEYFLKKKFDELSIAPFKEFLHFGLTSQDINNTAIPYALKEALERVFIPLLNEVKSKILQQAETWKNIPMLARTHGQPASPTRLGKEWRVFHERLQRQMQMLDTIPHAAKFGGATGNFNAHTAAYPNTDWVAFGNRFVNDYLGLHRSHPTTQIEHYDYLAALLDNLKRINTILIDFSRDIWQYIAMGYFSQKINPDEIGSSAMPHKVNPIDFENAEGNFGIANTLFEHLSAKLPVSRLQRDLTDSTALRNLGVPLAHSYVAFRSLLKGLGKIEVNEGIIQKDLEDNWAVVAEGIQTVLRREGYPQPYEALKALTRKNEKITREAMQEFINSLDISENVRQELQAITPYNYTGSSSLQKEK